MASHLDAAEDPAPEPTLLRHTPTLIREKSIRERVVGSEQRLFGNAAGDRWGCMRSDRSTRSHSSWSKRVTRHPEHWVWPISLSTCSPSATPLSPSAPPLVRHRFPRPRRSVIARPSPPPPSPPPPALARRSSFDPSPCRHRRFCRSGLPLLSFLPGRRRSSCR